MNIEAGFISKLIKTGDMKTVVEEQFKPTLLSGTYKTIYNYIMDYHLEYGHVPELDVINRYYPDFEPISTSKRKPLKWFIDELRTKALHNQIADMTEKVYVMLENKEANEAKDLLNKTVSLINQSIIKSQDVELTSSAQDLKDEFERLEKLGGMIGIPTLLKELDNCLKGLQKEQLITIMARLGVGKTWFLILLLVNIFKQGYDVALGTTEMSVEMIRRRVVAMMFNIPYVQLRSGKMILKDKKAYYKALDELSKKKNKFHIFKVSGGVSFIRTKLEQYKPDILGIDGMYLMEDDKGAQEETWRVAHITRDMHNLCSDMKMPIIGTTQANRQTSKKTGPEVDNLSYSDAVGQDSDVVLSLHQSDEMREDSEMEMRVLKQREGQRLRLMMEWNFRDMKFNSIYGEMEGEEFESNKEESAEAKDGRGGVKQISKVGLSKTHDVEEDELPEEMQEDVSKQLKKFAKSGKKKIKIKKAI